MRTLTKHENNLLQSLRDLELHGAGAYLIGALIAIESIAKNANVSQLLTTVAPSAPTKKTTTNDDDDDQSDSLAEITEIIERARGDRHWREMRRIVAEGIWEPGVFAGLVDRFAAGIICGFIPTRVGENLYKEIQKRREEHPEFKSYPLVTNRIRSAFRAAGYAWPPLENVLEPAPKKPPKKELVETSPGVFAYRPTRERKEENETR